MANASLGKHTPGNTANMPAVSAAAPEPADATVVMEPVGEPEGFVPASAGQQSFGASEAVSKRRAGKVAAIAAGCVAGVLLVAYGVGVAVFSNIFYPNTTIGGRDISMLGADEAAQVASQIGRDFTVHVTGQGLDFTIDSQNAGIEVNGQAVAVAALSDNQPWRWPLELTGSHDETEHLSTSFSESALADTIGKEVASFNETAEDAVNSVIAFDDEAQRYVVTQDQPGTKVEPGPVAESVNAAIIAMQDSAQIGEDALVQPTVHQDDHALNETAEQANTFLKANFEVVLGDTAEHVTDVGHELLAKWVHIDGGTVTFDEAAMSTWAHDLAYGLDTIGSTRTFIGADGAEHTVSGHGDGDSYGWNIDSAEAERLLLESIRGGYEGQLRLPCLQEAYQWKGVGEVDWGRHAEVSISQQHAWFLEADGTVIWETDVVTGRPDGYHDTARGAWQVLFKSSPYTMHGDIQVATGQPEYVTTVTYWMPFTYSGMGFHDATWQGAFGGSRYANGYGSHGCVNISYSAAESLYSIINEHNAVLVYD